MGLLDDRETFGGAWLLPSVTRNDPALTERMIPTLRRAAGAENVRVASLTGTAEDFSFFGQRAPGMLVFLLGNMEGNTLYNAFNFSTGCIFGCNNIPMAGNITVRDATVSSFLCPSDPTNIKPGSNYAASYGPQFRWDAGTNGVGTGMFALVQSFGIRNVTDGTSNTVAVSEKIIGDNATGPRNGAEW